jgi:hypothetical protein
VVVKVTSGEAGVLPLYAAEIVYGALTGAVPEMAPTGTVSFSPPLSEIVWTAAVD